MDGTREICWKVLRHELILVNGLEKPVVTHGTVLRTYKDEGLEADETDVEHVLRTLEVPQNGYKVAEQGAELQPIWELHTSLNRLGGIISRSHKSTLLACGPVLCSSRTVS